LKAGISDEALRGLKLPTGCKIARDADGEAVVLFPSEWTLKYFGQQNEGVALYEVSADSKE
jgi:peptide subunit release factor RF-3